MSLEDFTTWLVKQPDIGFVLRALDSHLKAQAKMQRKLPLPEEFKELAPAVDEFHNNQGEFVKYLGDLREYVPNGYRSEVNKLYRTVLSRDMQIEIRRRLKKALTVREKKYGELSYPEAIAYTTKLQRMWAAERLEFLKDVRKQLGRKSVGAIRLASDDLQDALVEFWQNIEDRIDAGDVPE